MMINYPISVFLDSNIYIGKKYNFSKKGTFDYLKKYIDENKIKLYTNSVVIGEVKKHINDNISSVINALEKIKIKDLKKISESLIEGTKLTFMFSDFEADMIKKEAISKFEKFLVDYKVEILDNQGINIDSIITDYFNNNPPFEESINKKCEFPDALIISKLKNHFSKNLPLYVISNDDGFRSAFNNLSGFKCMNSINMLLDNINAQEKILYNEIKKFFINYETRKYISDYIKSKIENGDIAVNGLDCDRKGCCDGYDYDYIYVNGISDFEFEVSSIDDIGDNFISLTLICNALINVSCEYEDYSNSYYDKEEDLTLFVSKKTIVEIHKPEFEIVVEVSVTGEKYKNNFKIENLIFDLVLDESSRLERIHDDGEREINYGYLYEN